MLGVTEMLLEIRNVDQVPGEPRRRWFFSHEQDLLIWFVEGGKPVAFQLSYGKYRTSMQFVGRPNEASLITALMMGKADHLLVTHQFLWRMAFSPPPRC